MRYLYNHFVSAFAIISIYLKDCSVRLYELQK